MVVVARVELACHTLAKSCIVRLLRMMRATPPTGADVDDGVYGNCAYYANNDSNCGGDGDVGDCTQEKPSNQ